MRIPRSGPCLALLAAGGAAVALAVTAGSGASAQAPTTRTLSFVELERGSTFTHVRNTRTRSAQSNSAGDLIVFTNPLADSSGNVVGRLHVQCVTTTGARDFRRSVLTCTGVGVLRDGTLALQASVRAGARTTTGAVTGGSGAYAGARGTFVSKERRRGGSDTTITLVA